MCVCEIRIIWCLSVVYAINIYHQTLLTSDTITLKMMQIMKILNGLRVMDQEWIKQKIFCAINGIIVFFSF